MQEVLATPIDDEAWGWELEHRATCEECGLAARYIGVESED